MPTSLITYDEIGKIPVTIWSLDAQYTDRYVTARANYLSGNIAHADQVGAKNGKALEQVGLQSYDTDCQACRIV